MPEFTSDPAHPEHEELVAWTAEGYDANVVDLVAANRRLPDR